MQGGIGWQCRARGACDSAKHGTVSNGMPAMESEGRWKRVPYSRVRSNHDIIAQLDDAVREEDDSNAGQAPVASITHKEFKKQFQPSKLPLLCGPRARMGTDRFQFCVLSLCTKKAL